VKPRPEVVVSWCQNLIRSERADWRDAQYCGAPALDFGDRNICEACHTKTEIFAEDLAERWGREIAEGGGVDEWLERNEALAADLYGWLDTESAKRAPLSKLHDIRLRIARSERVRKSVLDALTAIPKTMEKVPA